jgi:PAS domain S-box-containing protein
VLKFTHHTPTAWIAANRHTTSIMIGSYWMKTNKANLPKSTLSVKVGLAYGIVTTVAVLLNFVLGFYYSRQGIYAEAGVKAATFATSIGESAVILLGSQDIPSLRIFIQKTSVLPEVRYLAVTDVAGRVIATSQVDLVGVELRSDLITKAISSRTLQQRSSSSDISYVLPLLRSASGSGSAEVIGTLWVEMDYHTEFQQALRLFLYQAILNFLLTMGMFPIVYHIIHVLVIRRLVKFMGGINQVENGNFEAKVEIAPVMGSSDEINQMADRFDHMISALKQSTLETQRQYNFALQVMNSMAQGLVLLDREGCIEYVNPAFSQLLGCETEPYLGKEFLTLIEKEDAIEASKALFSSKDMDQVECRMTCSDLRQIDVLITISPRNKEDRTQGAILGITDLTNHAMLERMKSDFIHRASHELRTPLTTATLMVSLLDDKMNQGEDKEYWDFLKESIEKQQSLVESLLLLGRIDNGGFRLTPSPTYLAPLMDIVLGEMHNLLEDHELTVDYQADDQLPPVSGNDQALHEVFSALIQNAVRFTIKPGTLRVRLRHIGQGVRVSVQDEGIGVPENEIPFLFTRFFRASNATHLEIQGSGLGLYFVKSVITQLGGAVSVDSEVDAGSTFSIYLPEMHHSPDAA